MSLFHRALIWLGALLLSVAAWAIDSSEQQGVESDWLITGQGLGRYQGVDKSIAMIREIYPQSTISYERSLSVQDKALKSLPSAEIYYREDVVVRQGDEELFRADCMCDYYVKEQKWRVAQAGAYGLENIEARNTIEPTTTNPRYKTAEGIGVGNTVAELRKAYQTYKKKYDLIFIGDEYWTTRQDGRRFSSHIACLKFKSDDIRDQKPPYLAQIGFRLETIEVVFKGGRPFDTKGRQLATYLRNQFDPSAKIVEIITGYDCNHHFRH